LILQVAVMYRSTYASCTAPDRRHRRLLPLMLLWRGVSLLLLLSVGSVGPGHSLAAELQWALPAELTAAAPQLPAADTVQPYSPSPAWWERPIQEAFVNRGVAKIGHVLTRLVLETYCHGLHSIYIHRSHDVNLDDYAGKFVRAQYHYVKVWRGNIRCVRAPCGPHQEVGIVIERLTVLTLSEAEQALYPTGCLEVP